MVFRAILIAFKRFFAPKREVFEVPEKPFKRPERARLHHVLDAEKCIGCGMCERVCPARALHMTSREDFENPRNRKKIYPQIDYDRCIFCSLCVFVCPTGALQHVNIPPEPSEPRAEDLINTPQKLYELYKKRKGGE